MERLREQGYPDREGRKGRNEQPSRPWHVGALVGPGRIVPAVHCSPSTAQDEHQGAPAGCRVEQTRIRRCCRSKYSDLVNSLTQLDELCSAGNRMALDPPPHRPLVGGIVMVDIGQQQARLGLMDNYPD